MAKNPRSIPPVVTNPNDLFLMDIPTAAVRLSTTVFAVRELMRSGELVKVEIGHKWLVSPEALKAFIQKREQQALRAA
jgi:hypothetical protein